MKHFIVMVALVGITAISTPVSAMQRQHYDCRATSISPGILNQLSEPVGNAMYSETGDARWEHARAVAARDREYSDVEYRNNGRVDQDYKLASPLIDAKYLIASAEMEQVVNRKLTSAVNDLNAARGELDRALEVARPKQRLLLDSLWDSLQRTDLATTLCHGQSRGEDRYQYQRLEASLRREIHTL